MFSTAENNYKALEYIIFDVALDGLLDTENCEVAIFDFRPTSEYLGVYHHPAFLTNPDDFWRLALLAGFAVTQFHRLPEKPKEEILISLTARDLGIPVRYIGPAISLGEKPANTAAGSDATGKARTRTGRSKKATNP